MKAVIPVLWAFALFSASCVTYNLPSSSSAAPVSSAAPSSSSAPSTNWNVQTNYTDDFTGTSLDTARWDFRTNGVMDRNPPTNTNYSLTCSVSGGALVLTPEPAATADWWNAWYGPGVFTATFDWSATNILVELQVSFTTNAAASSHFAGLIIQDAARPLHYVKFVSFGSMPTLFDMNICRDRNGWPTNGYSHYLAPTTNLGITVGSNLADCLTAPNDTPVDFPDFVTNIFAVFVQHSRTNSDVVLRVLKETNRVTLYYSQDGGTTFQKGMSGVFDPAQVRIGMVANEMGKPFGGDGKARFGYIRVLAR